MAPVGKGDTTQAATHVRLQSAKDRAKLPPSTLTYWQGLSGGRGGLSLGFRVGPESRTWYVRLRKFGKIATKSLGAEAELTYAQAVAKAEAFLTETLKAWSADERPGLPLVRNVVEAYIAMMDKRPGGVGRVTHSRMHRHVLSHSIADKTLDQVTPRLVTAWAKGLPEDLSRETVKRIGNDLMAALQRADRADRGHLPNGWCDTLREAFRDVRNEWPEDVEPVERAFLTEEQVRAAAQHAMATDAGLLVAMLTQTGLRFSQVTRMTVADLIGGGKVRVPVSRKGKSGTVKDRAFVTRTIPVLLYAALVNASVGLTRTDLLFAVTEDGIRREWTHNEYQPVWRQCAEAAGAGGVPATALRDSSIIRMLEKNLPATLVARLHDTSVAIIDRHYGQHIADVLVHAEEAAMVDLFGGLKLVG